MNLRAVFIRILAIFCIIFAIIFASNSIFGGNGFDLTQDKLFTLDKSTKTIISNSKKAIEIDFYFSNKASTQNPQIRKYGQRARDILRQFAHISKGKVVLKEIDVNQFTPQEDGAISFGLLPYNDIQANLEPIYLGAVFKSEDKISKIPYFDPQNEGALEYEIAKSIVSLQKDKQNTIGIISGQDWFIENTPNGTPKPIAQIAQSIAAEHILISFSRDFSNLPPNLDLIFIVQPWALSDIQQYLLDQYVVNGGKIILCIDPFSTISADNGIGIKNYNQSLGRLEKSWNIGFSNEVLMDKKGALPVQANIGGRQLIMPQPLFFNASSANLDGLKLGINFASPSYFNSINANNLKVTKLISSSDDIMRIDNKSISSYIEPQEAANLWEGENKTQTLSQLLEGQFISAFDAPIDAMPFAKQTQNKGIIISIADSDFLADSLYQDNGLEIANNQEFVLNSIDYILGEAGLSQLRSKQKIKRNFTKIDSLKNAAQEQILEKQGVLNQELQTINQQIRELSPQENNPQIQNQLNILRQNALEKRGELRKLNEGIANSIDKIKNIFIAICAIIVPLILLIIWGIFYRKRQKIGLKINGKT